MSSENKPRGISRVNEFSETRLWKTLDDISDRLGAIENQLSEVVRLEERVNNHEQTISRFGNRIDNHDRRIHETELWQASYGDKTSVERLISNVQEEVKLLKKEVDVLEDNKNIIKGQRDITKEILKYVSGILAAILIFKLTRG